jgi:hypothetical protein
VGTSPIGPHARADRPAILRAPGSIAKAHSAGAFSREKRERYVDEHEHTGEHLAAGDQMQHPIHRSVLSVNGILEITHCAGILQQNTKSANCGDSATNLQSVRRPTPPLM